MKHQTMPPLPAFFQKTANNAKNAPGECQRMIGFRTSNIAKAQLCNHIIAQLRKFLKRGGISRQSTFKPIAGMNRQVELLLRDMP